MWSIDIIVNAGISLTPSVQIEEGDFVCDQINVFDIHAETLKLLNILDFVTGRKELDKPTIYEAARFINLSVRNISLEIKVVPEL